MVKVGETRMKMWEGLKTLSLITLAGFAGRGETLAVRRCSEREAREVLIISHFHV